MPVDTAPLWCGDQGQTTKLYGATLECVDNREIDYNNNSPLTTGPKTKRKQRKNPKKQNTNTAIP